MKSILDNNFNLAERIDYGVKLGVALALSEHKKTGSSIFITKNHKIIEVPPEQIDILLKNQQSTGNSGNQV